MELARRLGLVAQPAVIAATTPIARIDITLIMIAYSKWLLAESSMHITRKILRIPNFMIFYLAAPASENTMVPH